MKILDIGSGPKKYPGSISIDFNPICKPDILHDLNIYPWPINDNEFDFIYCSHCLEHLNDPIKAVEEIYRICKPNGKVVVVVPHYSGHTAWGSPEHRRAFGCKWFNYFTKDFSAISQTNARFKIIEVKLVWASFSETAVYTSLVKRFAPIIKIFNSLFSFLANLSVEVCEKIWCYWVGGFCEIKFELEVDKS